MNQLVEFDGIEIRVVGTPDKPEWVAADVCQVLGIAEPQNVLRSFKPSERGRCIVYTPLAGDQQMLTVTEPGLYRLIFKSRKPEAERFRTFVTHEVLPSIRQHGCWPPPELVHQQAAIIRIDEEALGRAIGNHMGAISDQLAAHRNDLHDFKDETRQNFDEVKSELQRIAHRAQLKDATKRMHVQVVYRMFGGKCPCCCRKSIVNSHGDKMSTLQFDHWKMPSINSVEWTWAVCEECNSRLRSGDFHRQSEGKFLHYQETRVRLQNILIPKLPGLEDV